MSFYSLWEAEIYDIIECLNGVGDVDLSLPFESTFSARHPWQVQTIIQVEASINGETVQYQEPSCQGKAEHKPRRLQKKCRKANPNLNIHQQQRQVVPSREDVLLQSYRLDKYHNALLEIMALNTSHFNPTYLRYAFPVARHTLSETLSDKVTSDATAPVPPPDIKRETFWRFCEGITPRTTITRSDIRGDEKIIYAWKLKNASNY